MNKTAMVVLAVAAALAGSAVAVAQLGGSKPDPLALSPHPGADLTPPAAPAAPPSPVSTRSEPVPRNTISVPSPAPPARDSGAPPAPPPPGAGPAPLPYLPPQPGGGEKVQPRAGMDNVHPVAWQSYETRSPTQIRVWFYSGVAPCSVLDSVQVAYRSSAVEVGLFAGSDPATPDVACIMIAQLYFTDVTLSQPLNGRAVIDPHRQQHF